MPIYEYQCRACGDVCEAWQKITEEPLKDCSVCGATGTLHRLISNTAFVLKGNGWYVTDFRDKKTGSTPPSSGKVESDAPAPDSCTSCTAAVESTPATETSPAKADSGESPAGNANRAAASKVT